MGPNRMPDAMSVRQKRKSRLPKTRIRALRLPLAIRLDGKCRLLDKGNREAAVYDCSLRQMRSVSGEHENLPGVGKQ